MKSLVIVAVLFLSASSFAQTAPSPSVGTAAELMSWVQTQQANVGVGLDWKGVKFVTTSWDLISFGQSGLNVAKAGAADYFDLGPMTSAANGEKTRYGALPLLHVGNVWNGINLPANIQSHIGKTTLPDVAAGLGFFEPKNGVLRSFKWKEDTQFVVVYRFGGS